MDPGSIPSRAVGELAVWEPVGRLIRTGSWSEQATPTLDRIDSALVQGRLLDAAALVRHLVVEADEIHDLYTRWTAEIPVILDREGVSAAERAAAKERLEPAAGDPGEDWCRFRSAAERFAQVCADAEAPPAGLDELVALWRGAHDRHRDLVAGWIDVAVLHLGEDRLGALWAELQADGVASYARYGVDKTAWPRSFELLVQIAIEGMHGHLGGPSGRGEVELAEHDDRVELRFAPCGSGGRIRDAERHGVTTSRHDWAWNELGVCHYCVHCCVLQQLEPIRRLGFPARVIDPPLRPGQPCTWTIYRDPALVPESAYRRVGCTRPEVPS